MVRINPLRYLSDRAAPSYPNKAPDSPRTIACDVDSGLVLCSETIPCFSPQCLSCLPLPVVVISSSGFCSRNKVNLSNVEDYINDEMLHKSASDAFFIYSQTSGTHTQIGICCALSIEDYQKGSIKKHELTIADKADIDTCNHFFDKMKNVDPVMIMYRKSETISDMVNRIVKTTAPVLMTSDDDPGCRDSMWLVQNLEDIVALQVAFAGVETMYIADGHHRSAAAVRKVEGGESAHWSPRFGHSKYILAAIFPDNQLRILPYNRCITTIGCMRAQEYLHRITTNFTIEQLSRRANPKPRRMHEICMFFEGKWYSLIPRPHVLAKFSDDPIGMLDPEILHRSLLKPILGIECPRSDKRLVYVCGDKGTKELEKMVTMGEVRVSFYLHNVSVGEVMNVADSGKLLPPKATFFDPKPMGGLIVRLL